MKIYAISDSLGETGINLTQSAAAQFPNQKFEIERHPLIRTVSLLKGILKKAKREEAVVVYTFSNPELVNYTADFCTENKISHWNPITPMINILAEKTGSKPLEEPGLNHHMNTQYFDRIESMEFAVQYDDGKDPAGFLQADIVLLGVSRTSKTPLSLYLANQGYKVANLPLVPRTKVPEQIFKVDPKRIIGLTTTPEVLNKFRRERMIAYGLDPDSNYSSMRQVEDELDNAMALYKKLGCLVINTAQKSIEETATLIIEALGEDKHIN